MQSHATLDDKALVADGAARIPALDGLRGITMMFVVACHLIWPRRIRLDAIDHLLVRGWIGVDLFFVLSGFLITGVLLDARGRAGYFREFYSRRALRIFPIYFLLLGIYFIVAPFVVWYREQGASWPYMTLQAHGSWYWLYLVNVLQVVVPNREWFGTAHLWSLSVEEQFYLVWPLVVLVAPRRRLADVCIAVAAAAILLRLWLVFISEAPYAAYVLTPARMDALAIGALVAVLARSKDASAWLRRWHRHVTWSALAVSLPIIWLFGDTLTSTPMATVGYTTTALAAAAFIVTLLVRHEAGGGGWLTHPALRRVGTLSYGAYLYHLPLIGLCIPIRKRIMAWGGAGTATAFAGHIVWIALMFALILAAAAVSYRLVERPFLALKDRGPRRRITALAGANAPG